MVVIAHRPSILAGMDKLLVLRDGKIEHFGLREEVMPKVTKAVPQGPEQGTRDCDPRPPWPRQTGAGK